MQMQNDMPMTIRTSKSKPEIQFQYGGRLFSSLSYLHWHKVPSSPRDGEHEWCWVVRRQTHQHGARSERCRCICPSRSSWRCEVLVDDRSPTYSTHHSAVVARPHASSWSVPLYNRPSIYTPRSRLGISKLKCFYRFKTRLPSNLRQTTRKCVYLVTLLWPDFWSCHLDPWVPAGFFPGVGKLGVWRRKCPSGVQA